MNPVAARNGPQPKHFPSDRRGGVLVVAALALPAVIGSAALVAEYGHALSSRVENQRVADLASYAGAVAYSKNQSEDEMRAAVGRMAQLNGLAPADVSAALVASPRDASAQAVAVDVTTRKTLLLARVVGSDTGLDIAATAMAEVGASAAPVGGCILALSASASGITLSGGTDITADDCEVSSNAAVAAPCGTSIRTKALNYDSATPPAQQCQTITSPTGGAATMTRKATADPLAGHAGVAALTGRLATAAALVAPATPAAPTVPSGTNLHFEGGYNSASLGRVQNAARAVGCTASWAQPKWSFTCPSNVQTVNVGSFTLGGGISVDFALTSPATTAFNFSGSITTASTVRFGPGTYKVAGNVTTAGTTSFQASTMQVGGAVTTAGTTTFAAGTYDIRAGLTTGGGSTTSFGAGTFRIGASAANCSGNRKVSICNTATLTFGGPSAFELAGGVYTSGGSWLAMGEGTANSYRFGPSTIGHAIEMGGGATLLMRDATGTDSVFEMAGNINPGGGGSCLAMGAAAHHDVKGALNGAGAMILGAGVWALDGYANFGANGGGSASCDGRSVSVYGEDVSIVVSGRSTPNNGQCASRAFCVTAGYSGIVLKSPTEGPYHHLAFVGPQDASVTHGALFAGGANNSQISGAFYFPHGPVVMSGGAGAAAVDEGCLTLIGTFITLSGGTSAVSQCEGLTTAGGPASGRVSLVR